MSLCAPSTAPSPLPRLPREAPAPAWDGPARVVWCPASSGSSDSLRPSPRKSHRGLCSASWLKVPVSPRGAVNWGSCCRGNHCHLPGEAAVGSGWGGSSTPCPELCCLPLLLPPGSCISVVSDTRCRHSRTESCPVPCFHPAWALPPALACVTCLASVSPSAWQERAVRRRRVLQPAVPLLGAHTCGSGDEGRAGAPFPLVLAAWERCASPKAGTSSPAVSLARTLTVCTQRPAGPVQPVLEYGKEKCCGLCSAV